MNLMNVFLYHTLRTNSPGLVLEKKKNCALKEMFSIFKSKFCDFPSNV